MHYRDRAAKTAAELTAVAERPFGTYGMTPVIDPTDNPFDKHVDHRNVDQVAALPDEEIDHLDVDQVVKGFFKGASPEEVAAELRRHGIHPRHQH